MTSSMQPKVSPMHSNERKTIQWSDIWIAHVWYDVTWWSVSTHIHSVFHILPACKYKQNPTPIRFGAPRRPFSFRLETLRAIHRKMHIQWQPKDLSPSAGQSLDAQNGCLSEMIWVRRRTGRYSIQNTTRYASEHEHRRNSSKTKSSSR